VDLISTLRYEAQRLAAEDAKGDDMSSVESPSLHPDLVRAFSLRDRVAVVTGGA
jgi:hypothetical protein